MAKAPAKGARRLTQNVARAMLRRRASAGASRLGDGQGGRAGGFFRSPGPPERADQEQNLPLAELRTPLENNEKGPRWVRTAFFRVKPAPRDFSVASPCRIFQSDRLPLCLPLSPAAGETFGKCHHPASYTVFSQSPASPSFWPPPPAFPL